jgi:flagella basal body P-ring formation protein FlgA
MQFAPSPAMRTTTTLSVCTALLAGSSAGLRAATTIDLTAISAAAENAVRARAGANSDQLILEAQPLDPRLRVSGCDRPLTGFLTDSNALRYQNTVGVRCDGSVRWTVFTGVHVESQTAVLVARRALARDAETAPADFKLETRRVPGLPSAYVTDLAALKGQRLSRPLPVDQPLSFEYLAPANLIHRGQTVVLVAHSGGFEVRVNGVALSDGRASEHIRVQNSSSQRVVEGIVRSESEVEAPL